MAGNNLEQMIEPLAAKVHAAWVEHRKKEGWGYGPRRDDALKQNPCLVDYDQLPESEKAVDRQTARTCIRALIEAGYEIRREGSDRAGPGEDWLEELWKQPGSQTALPPDVVVARWQQWRNIPNCPPGIFLKLGEHTLRQGEPILAYDILSRGLAALERKAAPVPEEKDLRLPLKQKLALALAQSGATERACRMLNQLCEEGSDTPETLGLLGRVYKDLSARARTETERTRLLQESLRCYGQGFEQGEAAYRASRGERDAGDAYYCGINAAAIEAMLGDLRGARAAAGRVREICQAQLDALEHTPDAAGYWLLATLAEALFIGGDFEVARRRYQEAVGKSAGNWRELTSTQRQLRLLAKPLGQDASEWDTLFPRMGVVVFASPSAGTSRELPVEAWGERLRQELSKRLKESGIMAGYLSALSPADLILGEALRECQAEVHFFLPSPREACRGPFAAQPDWGQRFDSLLSYATSVTDDTEVSHPDEDVNRRFAGLRAYGSGCLRARYLDVDLHLWGLQAAASQSGSEEENNLARHWQHLGCSWESIPAPGAGGPLRGGSPEPKGAPSAIAPSSGYEIRAMLFADFKGYSSLDDASLCRFHQQFMPVLARGLQRFGDRILLRRTAGDGLFLVFADIETAIQAAFALISMVDQASWREFGLPFKPAIRVSLDAGPVHTFQDPVTNQPEVCGKHVNRAARIEPITPSGEIYASEAFAALYVAAAGRAFRFDYVGQTELPKGFGLTPLYCVSRNLDDPGDCS
jgi:class 3 adenylate cyclase/tetratricopeptide (TPR) repeat protein